MAEVVYRVVRGGQVPATDGFVVVMERRLEDGTITRNGPIVATFATEAEAQADADRRGGTALGLP